MKEIIEPTGIDHIVKVKTIPKEFRIEIEDGTWLFTSDGIYFENDDDGRVDTVLLNRGNSNERKGGRMKIVYHKVFKTGNEQIDVEIKPPKKIQLDPTAPVFCPDGGSLASFIIDHTNDETSLDIFHQDCGLWVKDDEIEAMKGCWTEDECLRYCEEEYGDERAD